MNFYGKTRDLNLYFNEDNQEDFKVRFSVKTTSLNVYGDNDDLTLGLRTKKMFDASGHNTIAFRTEDIFVLGEDWFQVRGKMKIKGIEKTVRLQASPVTSSGNGHTWILEGKINLDDFGIHSDLPEHAPDSEMGGHMMFLNMKVPRKVSDPNLEGC
ncbi:MAG: polyisoprenoid-binding protein YceI [bacterium]